MTDKPTPTTDLLKRCAEIHEWRSTGVLSGEALRDYAKRKWPDRHDTLQMAEHETVTEALALLAKWGQPAHSGEPVAWLSPWRADQVTTDYDAYGERGIPLYTAPQPSPTAQSADSVQKDAARYRWLRDTSNADDPSHMIALHIREEQNDASLSGIDAAIDAALAAQGGR